LYFKYKNKRNKRNNQNKRKVYDIAALGKYGGDHVADILIDGLKNNMVQLGVRNLGEC